MTERRKGERRDWGTPPEYPFIDSDGMVVGRNRRRIVDRRMSSFDSSFEKAQSLKALHLQFNDATTKLVEDSRGLVVGRSSNCDIKIKNRYTSRIHARFEYRDGRYVLVDESTNGTFLSLDSGEELHLVDEEMPLSGAGIISLGLPVSRGGQDIIHFHVEE